MSSEARVVVVLVSPETGARRPARLLRWLRWLLPAAFLIVSRTPIAIPDSDDLITLNADAVDASPLAVVDAIVKARAGR